MLRIAVIGAGRIGKVHAATVAAHPQARLVLVCDPFIEAAKALADPLGARASADAAEAFEKAATLRKQAEVIEERLRDAYATYEKSSKADRAQLRAAIRTDERTLDDLRTQIKTWEKRARNAENRTIIK